MGSMGVVLGVLAVAFLLAHVALAWRVGRRLGWWRGVLGWMVPPLGWLWAVDAGAWRHLVMSVIAALAYAITVIVALGLQPA